MTSEDTRALVADTITELYDIDDINVVITRPDAAHGDFTTNVAMQLSGRLGRAPRDIATDTAEELRNHADIVSVDIAGPGFLNIRLHDDSLLRGWTLDVPQSMAGQAVVAEYSDPNPFKVLHAGHLYTSVMGDAIANIAAVAGADVHRVNFGGDVGLHVGKTMWAIVRALGGENPDALADIPQDQRSDWMAARYVEGSKAYDDDDTAKSDIVGANKRVYQLHADNDHETPFAQIYWTCRDWSYAYFNDFYARIGSGFEKYYPESSVAERGLAEVRSHIGDVFEESNGAIVFDGDKHGLHTRVFINQAGLPTYEAKDVGLIFTKHDDYHFDRSIIITSADQGPYMQVVLKAIDQFAPELARATTHLTHGIVKLAGGVKMSSRLGNFLRARDILDVAMAAADELHAGASESISLGAVKYAFLRQRMGGDIVYDPDESVSLQGNSGPYLMYAHARARSVLAKATDDTPDGVTIKLDEAERQLARTLSEYSDVLDRAVNELMPHHICNYLYELAVAFNRFYEKSRVIGDERQAVRLMLVERYADTLRHGLGLLGIDAPDKM